MITSGVTGFRSTGSTLFRPFFLSHLAKANAEIEHLHDAWRCIDEAITGLETAKERWCEAEVNRIAGEVALLSPEQHAKSWELRAAAHLPTARPCLH